MKRDFRRRKQGAAPSFSVSNESAELLCRHGRHYLFYMDSIWQCTLAILCSRQAFPDLVPMAEKRTEG